MRYPYLVISCSELLLDILLRPSRKGRDRVAVQAMSASLKLRNARYSSIGMRSGAGVRDILAESLELVHGD